MSRKKILLVDDSSTILMMERMILDGPYDLVTASDGVEAIAMATAERPDLILMDANMPRLNGFEACRVLRGQELTRATPIVMVTTHGEAQNFENGYDGGCSGYVTKPINANELLTKLRVFLGE